MTGKFAHPLLETDLTVFKRNTGLDHGRRHHLHAFWPHFFCVLSLAFTQWRYCLGWRGSHRSGVAWCVVLFSAFTFLLKAICADGECVQTIVHPAISVWSVASMPNGDIVSGCSDGVVRVFSTSEERWATAEDLKAYEDTVASQSIPSCVFSNFPSINGSDVLKRQQVGDVKKSDLPGLEALSDPGLFFSRPCHGRT